VARFAIAYATSEGRTRVVVDHLADALRAHHHQVTVHDVGDSGAAAAVTQADAVVLAGSIHGGRLQPRLVGFASVHGVALAERPGALLVVSLSAASRRAEIRQRVDEYLRTFLACTPWRPDVVESIAGALQPDRLGPIRRSVAARVARQVGLDGGAHDCTDWQALQRFADSIARWFPRVGVPTRAPGGADRQRDNGNAHH